MAETIKLVTFGKGGDMAYCGGPYRTRIGGYGTPERPHAAESTPEHPIPDGTPALDLRPAVETIEGARWAIRGPMLDPDMDPNAPGPFGAWDWAPIPVYIRGWREHGARVGHYHDGRIVWES